MEINFVTNPHCEHHIYRYDGKLYLLPWGGECSDPAYEIVDNKTLVSTDVARCDISDGEFVRCLDCTECPFAKDCGWDDLPEAYAVDHGWRY
jgi:hypothetical protein